MVTGATGHTTGHPPADVRRKRFLYLWRHRLSSLRAMSAVTRLLDDAVTGPEACEWVVQACADIRSEREREVVDQRRLRASMVAASSLLVRACQVEGMPLAAVAHGVLPNVLLLRRGEGFQWRATDALAPWPPIGVVGRSVAWPRFLTRFYTDAAMVRPEEHPSGGWAVRLIRGALLPSMALGGCRLMSTGNGRGVIDIPATYPDAVRIALRDRRVVDVVEHPVFEDARFVIRSAVEVRGRTRIAFSCPLEPISFDALRPPAGQEHIQLGRDGSLTGADAVRDVLSRRPDAPFLVGRRRLGDGLDVDYLEGVELDRLWRINMMAPPWAERLPIDVEERTPRQVFSSHAHRFPFGY